MTDKIRFGLCAAVLVVFALLVERTYGPVAMPVVAVPDPARYVSTTIHLVDGASEPIVGNIIFHQWDGTDKVYLIDNLRHGDPCWNCVKK